MIALIEFQNVSKTFKNDKADYAALQNISLTIADNEIFGIVGESGAGKSTLLRCINALESITSGKLVVNGQDVSALNKPQLRAFREQVGMVFQQFNLLSNKTVAENILLPLALHPYENPLSLEEVLTFVGLENKADSYPANLSGGQKQRVGIARALITRPKVLLCDEPTSALDEGTTNEIIDVLRHAHNTFDVTIVLVTHELAVIKALCKRAAVLEHGVLADIIEVHRRPKVAAEEQTYSERVREVLTHG